MPLPPDRHGLHAVFSPAGKILKRWVAQYGIHKGREVNLKCGNQKDGYRHIKKNHFHEWKGLADIEGISWMDVADMAITKSLTHASFWKNSTERGSTCYSGTIYLVDRVRGIPVKEVYPSVIAGNVSNKIVTAFPGAKCLRH